MLLYDSRASGNCYKVRLLFAHLGVAYERRELDVVDRSGRIELLGAISPGLRVPALVLDDVRALAESNAILWYFSDGTSYLPHERLERAGVLQWMFFEQYSHEPNIAVLRFWALHPDAATPTQAETEAKLTAGYAALDALERHLRSNEFLVADRYSVADISLDAYTHVAEDGGFDLERYPRLREWLQRVRAQPGHVGIDA